MNLPEWTTEWQQGEFDHETVMEFVTSIPDECREIVARFPPGCLVMATRALGGFRMDQVGIVSDYIKPTYLHKAGQIKVRTGPGSPILEYVRVDDLKVVGFWQGLDLTKIKEYL